MPFPKWVRRRMFARDGATCQTCGKRWDDGWMLQASHYEDGIDSPTSNELDAGRMTCVLCHLAEHVNLYNLARKRGNKKEMQRHKFAVESLRKTNVRRIGF